MNYDTPFFSNAVLSELRAWTNNKLTLPDPEVLNSPDSPQGIPVRPLEKFLILNSKVD